LRLLLAACFVLLPLPAAAFVDLWNCTPAGHLVCRAGESCRTAEPRIDQVEIMPITGRLSFCIGAQCYEGVMELEREGWPDYRTLGTATVEALPLSRRYTGGEPWFVAFEEEARRFTLSSLGPAGQDLAWFDCRPWGE
jgi:hypothetical protein